MNLSHFHRQPIFLQFNGLPKDPAHELFTELTYAAVEYARIRCRCGWEFKRPLFEMYNGPREAFFDSLGEAAYEHIRSVTSSPTLAELETWGWFSSEAP